MKKGIAKLGFVVAVLLVSLLLTGSNSLASGGIPPFPLPAPSVTEEIEGEGAKETFEPIPNIQGVPFYRQDDKSWKCEQLGSCNCNLNLPPAGENCLC